eukprot:15020891-Alexandrium_andersonii.AAC.1
MELVLRSSCAKGSSAFQLQSGMPTLAHNSGRCLVVIPVAVAWGSFSCSKAPSASARQSLVRVFRCHVAR